MWDDHELTLNRHAIAAVRAPAGGQSKALSNRKVTAVDLLAGRTYTLQLANRNADRQAPRHPIRLAVHDEAGALVATATLGNHTGQPNYAMTFVATRSGTHYVVAVGNTGELQLHAEGIPPGPATETDGSDARAGATDLGDITDVDGPRLSFKNIRDAGEGVAYCRFTLTHPKRMSLALKLLNANAELELEDLNGEVICTRENFHAEGEWMWVTLHPGTYYARVDIPTDGDHVFVLRYRVSAADPNALEVIDGQSIAPRQRFTIPAFAFGANYRTGTPAEPGHGSTFRISLGTVSTGELPGHRHRYRLIGGNELEFFELDERTGELFFIGSEADVNDGTSDFDLIVRASDGERSVDKPVPITIARVLEPLEFGTRSKQPVSAASIKSPHGPRISLGTVSGVPPLAFPVSYRLVSGNEAGLFELDEATGELFFNGTTEDFEKSEGGFQLAVRAEVNRN